MRLIKALLRLVNAISQGLEEMPKLIFLRQSQNDLLLEQNRLLQLLLAKQTATEAALQKAASAPAPAIVYTRASEATPEIVEENFPDFEVEMPYVPKALKATAQISQVETSKEAFDIEDVQKLKEAKEKANK
jgi:uncharacterized membrane protein